MRRMTPTFRADRLYFTHQIFGGAQFDIGQYRRTADTMMSAGRVGAALDLIAACAELRDQYQRSGRLVLTDADRQRLQALAEGAL